MVSITAWNLGTNYSHATFYEFGKIFNLYNKYLWVLYYYDRGFVTKYQMLGGLDNRIYFSWFWKLQVKDQDFSRVDFF